MVSVQTGEVLTTVTVEKNLLSTADGATALKFFNQATRAFEFDSSQTFNEPGNYALRSAIETAVVELINKGERQNLWQFKAPIAYGVKLEKSGVNPSSGNNNNIGMKPGEK